MYYEVGYEANKRNEAGDEFKEKMLYLVYAETFGMAETLTFEELEKVGGMLNFEIKSDKQSNISKVITSDMIDDDKYFKALVVSEYIDDNGKDKTENNYILVQANDNTLADSYAKEWAFIMFGKLAYVKSTNLTKIVEVIEIIEHQ